MNFRAARTIHFIGIGGIGLSAIARLGLKLGKKVSGSDRRASPVTAQLENLGAQIYFGEAAEHLPLETELVIHTIAITPDNPEWLEAKRRGLAILTYPEVLGQLSRERKTVAVSGTHGKTTTTAMLGQILVAAGMDPLVIVGSLLQESGSNLINGEGEYFVVEACEYRRSFLNLSPSLLIITNIDNDHLDYYRDLADIQSAFAELASRMPADGFLICDPKDERLKPVLEKTKAQIIDYTLEKISVPLLVPGAHNQNNAKAALAAARAAGVPARVALSTLSQFTGTWRRFQAKGKTKNGALVYDDYAHHPTEIKATLAGAREAFPEKKLVAVFQPHLYSRTKQLFSEFAASFSRADEVLLLPIYAAREALDPTISSERLVEALKQAGKTSQVLPDLMSAAQYLTQPAFDRQTLIVTLGAGDIFELAQTLVL